jgi:dihydrofolate reductase
MIICHSVNELSDELKEYPTDDVFVIGGESVYTQLLPYCTEVYATKIENRYRADKYFVNLDKEQTWEMVFKSAPKNYNNVQYRFERYVNVKRCNEISFGSL